MTNSAQTWRTWKNQRVAHYAVQATAPAIRPADGAVETDQKPGFTFWMFCVYVFIVIGRPQDYLPFLAPFRLALVFSWATLLLTMFRDADARRGALNNIETRLYFGLFVVMCVGIPFALFRHAAFDFVIRQYVANLIFFALFVIHVNTAPRLRKIVLLMMVTALVFSAVGLSRGRFIDGRFDTGSPIFDANDVPFILIGLLPFAVAALMGASGWIRKGIALVSVLLSVVLALYSGSRGGLVGLGTFLFLFLALGIGRVKKVHKILFILALAAAAYANADKLNMDRYETIGSLQDDYNVSDEFGRAQIWKRGMQLFWDSPLTGVGVSCFPEALGRMREDEGERPEWQTAHNSYVLILTETGAAGALFFVLLIGTCLINFNRYRRLSGGVFRQQRIEALLGLLFIGFTSMLVSGFFISQSYSMPFTLYFALSASLKRIGGAPVLAPHASLAVSSATRFSNA